MEKLFPRCDEPCEGYKIAIQLVEKAATRVSAWRSVADERPPISDCRPADPTKTTKVRTEVIVATKEGRVFATVFTTLGFANINSRTDEVTHWMPKPDHPATLTA